MPPAQRPPAPKNKGKDLVETSRAKTTQKQLEKKQDTIIKQITQNMDSLKLAFNELKDLTAGEERTVAPTPRRPPPKE